MSTNALPRVAILDDYQGVALSSADWSPLNNRVVIDVFRDTVLDESALVQRLEPYAIVCAMRERTKFPASLLDKLPNLKFVLLACQKIDILISTLQIYCDYRPQKCRYRCYSCQEEGRPSLWHVKCWERNLGAYLGLTFGYS